MFLLIFQLICVRAEGTGGDTISSIIANSSINHASFDLSVNMCPEVFGHIEVDPSPRKT